MLGVFIARFSTYAWDCLGHSPTTARGLHRSLLDLRSGTASITLRPQLGDFVARFSTYARGLP